MLIIMSVRIRNRQLNILWPIYILKFCLPFVSFTFFGQCFIALFSVFDCDGEYSFVSTSFKCHSGLWFTILAPINGIILFFLCIIALITNSLYFKSVFSNCNSDILKKTNSLPDNVFLITKIELNLLFLLDKNNENNQWIILFFAILFTSTNAYYTLYYQNRVNKILKLLNNIFSLILVSAFLSLLIGKMFIQLEFSGAIYLFFSFIFIIILYIIFYKNKETNYISIDYKEIYEPSDYLNYLFKFNSIIANKKTSRNNYTILESLLYKIEERCIIPECPLKKYIEYLNEGIECSFLLNQFCEKLFEYGISKFNDDISLKINYAIFLISHMNYQKKALMILNRIDKNISFQNNFFMYRTLKLSEKRNFSLININKSNYQYRQYAQEFKALIKKLTLLYYEFLSLLCNNTQNNDNFNKMHKIGRKIMKNNPKIDKIYEKLINIQTNNIEIIKLYTEFVEGILHDEEKLEKCQNNPKITFNNSIKIHEKDFTNFDIEILNEKGSRPYMIISAQKEEFGKIIDISLNALKIFGYAKPELLGQHINILIPKSFHKAHNIILGKQNENHRIKFFDGMKKQKTYFPEFIKKELFGISKMKFLIELFLNIYFVKTEENKLVYIVIIENYNPFKIDLINNNNNNSKCVVLTDENFLIQTFTPNSLEMLNLNYSDINSNFNIINYIKQFQEDYLTAINSIGTSKYSHINKSEIFSEDKSDFKTNKYSIPPLVRKKIKNDLFSRKYSKKCKITWRINYDTNISFSRIQKRNVSSKILSDYSKSNIFRQTKTENNFLNDEEKTLYMKIEKIILNQEFLGYYFYFTKEKNKNNINMNYIHEKSDIKDRNNNIIKLKKYQCTFKNHEHNFFEINEIDMKKDSMFSSVILKPIKKKFKEKKEYSKFRKNSIDTIKVPNSKVNIKEVKQNNPINNCSFINFKKDGLNLYELLKDDDNDDDTIITGDFIPEYFSHFLIDLKNPSFYQVDSLDENINYIEILKKEANEKISSYQNQLKLNKIDSSYNESDEESDESSSDSDSNTNIGSSNVNSLTNSLYENYRNQSSKTNNISSRKEKENEYPIRKTPSKFSSKMVIPESKPSEKNIIRNIVINKKVQKKNVMVNNYYKVNLSNVLLYLYDFNKEQIVEINKVETLKEEEKKKEQSSKIEILLTAPKKLEPIDFEKEERFAFINLNNLKSKKISLKGKENKENSTSKNRVTVPINIIKDNIKEEKLIRKKIYESLNKTKDELPIKKLKILILFSFFVLLIYGILIIILDLQYYSRIEKSLDGIKYCSIIKYCCQIGIYYLREMTLLNFKIEGLKGGKYTEFVGKEEVEYIQLMREELMELFIKSQTSIKSIYSITFPKNNSAAETLDQFKANIRISNSPKIDMKLNISMILMHYSSTFFNLAFSSSAIEQNHPDLRYFIYNSLNGYFLGFENIIKIYKTNLEVILKKIVINSLISCIIVLVFYIIIYVLIMKNFLNAIKTRGNYMKVFYGINENIIKKLINNCENFVNKLKSAEEQRNFEEETLNESVEDKINIEENQKNRKISISYNSNLNYGFESRSRNRASMTANFFIVIDGLFNLISYSYFICNWIYLINIGNKSLSIYQFWSKVQSHHISIIEYFNVYREYLFDDKSISNGILSLDFLDKFEKKNILDLREDAKYIMTKGFLILPESRLGNLFEKSLCAYYINDYFDSSYECEEKVGLISTYQFDELAIYFLEEIKIGKNIAKYKFQNETILGNLTNYNFTEFTEYISIIGNGTNYNDNEEYSVNNNVIFRLDLFNNETLHKKLNVMFFSIILPFIRQNAKIIFNAFNENGGKMFLILFNVLFYTIVAFVYFCYFIPVINYINTNIYKTKNMLSIIPLNVLSSQNGVLKLLKISPEK